MISWFPVLIYFPQRRRVPFFVAWCGTIFLEGRTYKKEGMGPPGFMQCGPSKMLLFCRQKKEKVAVGSVGQDLATREYRTGWSGTKHNNEIPMKRT